MDGGRDESREVSRQSPLEYERPPTVSEQLAEGAQLVQGITSKAKVRHLPEYQGQRRGMPWLLCGNNQARHGRIVILPEILPMCRECERKADKRGLDKKIGVRL